MIKGPSAEQQADLAALERKLGHTFTNIALLELALTHPSCTVEPLTDNERLEFLGDSVLALAVNEHLFHTMPDQTEGELTRIKSSVVSTVTLARVSRRLGLADYMRLGKGLGGRGALPDSVHANVTEAVFAAIYLDAGLTPVKGLIVRLLEPEIAAVTAAAGSENAKSQMQELAQREYGCQPRYRLLREKGPEHGKVFVVAVELRGRIFPEFSAHTKKDAEQGAARLALEAIAAEKAVALRPRPAPAPASGAGLAPAAAPSAGGSARHRRRGRRGGRGRTKAAGRPKNEPSAGGRRLPAPPKTSAAAAADHRKPAIHAGASENRQPKIDSRKAKPESRPPKKRPGSINPYDSLR